MPSISGLLDNLTTKTALNIKTTDVENKISDITNLATKAALNITKKWKAKHLPPQVSLLLMNLIA